eukprot:158452_1
MGFCFSKQASMDTDMSNSPKRIINLTSKGLANGVLKFQLHGFILSDQQSAYDCLSRCKLHLFYKNANTDWISKPFNTWIISKYPVQDFWQINVRVDTNLMDYKMEFKIGIIINKDAYNQEFQRQTQFPENKLLFSNTLSISIPSSLKPQSFEVDNMVQVQLPDFELWCYGLIKHKYDINQPKYGKYDVLTRQQDEEKVITIINTKNKKVIKRVSVEEYIDLSSVHHMECMFLLGDRKDIDADFVGDVYAALSSVFYNDYVTEYMTESETVYVEVDFMSMAKLVAVKIIDCLWNRMDKGYKVKCLMGNDDIIHVNEYLKLYQQREFRARRAIETKCEKPPQDRYTYCDMCLCQQGDYYWVWRCQLHENR